MDFASNSFTKLARYRLKLETRAVWHADAEKP